MATLWSSIKPIRLLYWLLPQRFDRAYHARRSKKADVSVSLRAAESYATR